MEKIRIRDGKSRIRDKHPGSATLGTVTDSVRITSFPIGRGTIIQSYIIPSKYQNSIGQKSSSQRHGFTLTMCVGAQFANFFQYPQRDESQIWIPMDKSDESL
jgi:hypothetical protein